MTTDKPRKQEIPTPDSVTREPPEAPAEPVERLLSIREAALRLDMSREKVNHEVRSGRLGCVQINQRVRKFTVRQINNYIERLSVAAEAPRKESVPMRPAPVVTSQPRKPKDLSQSQGHNESDPKVERKEIGKLWQL